MSPSPYPTPQTKRPSSPPSPSSIRYFRHLASTGLYCHVPPPGTKGPTKPFVNNHPFWLGTNTISTQRQRNGEALPCLRQVSRPHVSTCMARTGRWCWTTYTGKYQSTLTVYSIYKPIKNLNGPLSVYQQHRTHLSQTISPSTDPLQTFDTDLIQELKVRLSHGEHLLIGSDINEEIFQSTLASAFTQLGLQEAIISHHDGAVPSLSTHIRNDRNRIIDGIWTTPSLVIRRSGYTSFSTWDHRTASVDLDIHSSFGTPHKHHSTRFSGRWLAATFTSRIGTKIFDSSSTC